MGIRRELAAACSTVLIACGLVGAPFLTGAAVATEVVQDGGFEAATGDPPNSPDWVEFDSNFGSPLCTLTATNCNTAGPTSPPRTGNAWAWFGGSAFAGHTASITQSIVIPVGVTNLTYWYRNGVVNAPFDAQLLVKVDGTTVKTHVEASTAEPAYTRQTVSLGSFANGASHTLSFNYSNPSSGNNSMVVDDISLSYPETSFTAKPGSVSTSLTVSFAFASSEPGSSFVCSLDGAAFAACTSPTKRTVTAGAHTFKVAAKSSAGNTDASPASASFTALDCVALGRAYGKAAKKVGKLKKAVKGTKVHLAQEVKAGHQTKVDQLEKQLAKQVKALKAAKRKLKVAQSAAAPCL
jgi:hypothetical protein